MAIYTNILISFNVIILIIFFSILIFIIIYFYYNFVLLIFFSVHFAQLYEYLKFVTAYPFCLRFPLSVVVALFVICLDGRTMHVSCSRTQDSLH